MNKVLIVDDNQIMRKLISGLLINIGIEPEEASNGEECLEILNHNAFDLVITDIVMPKMEGIELIRRIKNEYPFTKIIAISGSKPYYLYLAKKMGVYAVFTKPLTKNSFLSIVQNIMNYQMV